MVSSELVVGVDSAVTVFVAAGSEHLIARQHGDRSHPTVLVRQQVGVGAGWSAPDGDGSDGKGEPLFRSSPAVLACDAEERLWSHEEKEEQNEVEESLPLSALPAADQVDAAGVAGAALCEQLSAYLEAQRVEYEQAGLEFDLWVDLLANKELFGQLAAVVAGLHGEHLPAARFLDALFCALGASFFTRLVKVQDLAAALQGWAALAAEDEDAECARSRVEAQDWVWASETDEGLPFSLPENVQRFQCWPKELFLDEFEAQVNRGVVDLEGDELQVQLAEHIYCVVQRRLLGCEMDPQEEAALVRTVKELASLRGLDGTGTLSQLSALANYASRYASSL
jgi:hypothetical protein